MEALGAGKYYGAHTAGGGATRLCLFGCRAALLAAPRRPPAAAPGPRGVRLPCRPGPCLRRGRGRARAGQGPGRRVLRGEERGGWPAWGLARRAPWGGFGHFCRPCLDSLLPRASWVTLRVCGAPLLGGFGCWYRSAWAWHC